MVPEAAACWHSCTARGRYSGDVQGRISVAWLPGRHPVDETVILEIKAVPLLLPVHDMQLQTYPRVSGLPLGLLLNFHTLSLEDSQRRFVG
jgi:PD-(D/E)XK nuclease superfamily